MKLKILFIVSIVIGATMRSFASGASITPGVEVDRNYLDLYCPARQEYQVHEDGDKITAAEVEEIDEVQEIEFDTSTPYYDWRLWLQENQTKRVETHCNDEYDLIMSYLYETGGFERYRVRKSLGESDTCDYKQKSFTGYWRKGQYYHDRGICQLSAYYKSDFFIPGALDNPLWQADRCIYEYEKGTTFYWSATAWDEHIYKWYK